MSYSCYCDYDYPQFCTVRTVAARKTHRCYECAGIIEPGERYENVVGKWDGQFLYMKICERCHDLRVWTQNNVPCLCWAYGNLEEDCREAVLEAVERAPEETKGLYFGFLRRLVTARRLNKERKQRWGNNPGVSGALTAPH